MLGRLALAAGDTAAAGKHLAAAAGCFRDGDYLTELADTLADLADHARAAVTWRRRTPRGRGDHHRRPARPGARPLRRAGRPRPDPRQPGHPTANPGPHLQGRDAADAALRLAARHQLAWHELDALRAHAALDHAEGTDRGWASQADALRARLVPRGLDPDPLATVERLVAAQKSRRRASRWHRPGRKG